MLTYLINVTGDLCTISLVIGVVLAFADRFMGERSRSITRYGLLLGFIVAGIRAYITNTRRLVGGWKVGVYGYVAGLIMFIALAVLFVLFMKGEKHRTGEEPSSDSDEKGGHAGKGIETSLAAVTGLLMAAYMYGALPNVYVYPFKFDIGTSSVLSTDFLFRLGGYLLGIIICLVAMLAAYKITTIASRKGYTGYLIAAFIGVNILYAVFTFARLMLVLTPRKIIDSQALFKFAAWSNNNSSYYTYIAFAIVLVIAAILWVKSINAREPYRTKAEHRKQLALWRSNKRYTVVSVICLVMAVLCSTWFVKLNTVEIHEAPVEETIVEKGDDGSDETLIVPVDAVSDGHMHRFGYEVDGHLVRFIIVLKQENTTNYGVGLDACDICGEAGYYENKDGQIVCKKCDVVMNRTTIGMKGGCNPVIIDYDFDGSNFTVPVSEMVKNKDKFSSGQ